MTNKNWSLPWIKLWKKSMNHELYRNGKPFDEWHDWIDILLQCDEKSGTFKTTLKALKIRWNWNSIKAVRAYLGTLKGTNMIVVEGTFGRNGGITIKPLKYWVYQASADEAKSKKGHIKKGKKGTFKGRQKYFSTEEGSPKPSKDSGSAPSELINKDWENFKKEDFDD